MTVTKYTSKLSGARVLVIGGTSGVGFCVAEAALEHGAIVTVASSRQDKLDRTVARLEAAYPEHKQNILSVQCNIVDSAGLEESVEAALKVAAGGDKLDHIVYTASPPIATPPLAEMTMDVIDRGASARVRGALILAKHAMRYVRHDVASSFTMTSGTMADKPLPGWAIGASFNAAVFGLTRSLAGEMKPIRVNAITLGLVKTELLDDMGFTDEDVKSLDSTVLTGGIASPEDVAEAYLYLMKDKFATGSILTTDGGRLLI